MRPAHVVEIVTPKKYLLNGLWFGPARPKRVFIFVHGLTGSAFSMRTLTEALVDRGTAVFTFNNRCLEQVTSIKRIVGKKVRYVLAGAAHEVFTECRDDIQGAVDTARSTGASEIFLVGHSTGAQKCVYWAAKGGKGASGIVLLGPLSDYSGALKTMDHAVLLKGVAHARKLVAAGNPHELMPKELREWFECDAQRYLSLYTPDTAEDTFPYAFPEKKPKLLEKVQLPILTLLAERDEYADLSAPEIAAWFAEHLSSSSAVSIIPNVDHSFKGGQQVIVSRISAWAKNSMKATS